MSHQLNTAVIILLGYSFLADLPLDMEAAQSVKQAIAQALAFG
jgi:hypothetical protein